MGGETPINGHWDTLSRIQQRAYMIRSWYDFRQASLMAQLVKKKKKKKKNNAGEHKTRSQSPGWEDPLEEEMATHFTILA